MFFSHLFHSVFRLLSVQKLSIRQNFNFFDTLYECASILKVIVVPTLDNFEHSTQFSANFSPIRIFSPQSLLCAKINISVTYLNVRFFQKQESSSRLQLLITFFTLFSIFTSCPVCLFFVFERCVS